jgi:hypothetical protein
VIVDTDGGVLGTVEDVNVGPIRWRLNSVEEWSFTCLVHNTAANLILDENVREAQVWQGDLLLSWGPITRVQVTDTLVTCQVKGASWYLDRRYIGKAERENHLVNPSFEDGLAGWNFLQTAYFLDFAAITGVTSSEFSYNAINGTRVLRIESTMTEFPTGYGSVWGDVFGWQEIEVSGGERGATCTLAVWVWVDTNEDGIPPGEPFDQYEVHRYGPLLARLETDWRTNNAWGGGGWGGAQAFYTDVLEASWARMDENTPKDQWVRMECSILVPPHTTQSVIARLSGLGGTVFFDRASFTIDTAFEAFDVDQAEIVCDLVEHAQDVAFDKNDVNLSCSWQPTGVERTLVLLHSEHANIGKEVVQFTKLYNGLDVSTEYTPSARTITTHYPRKGSHRSSLRLETGRNVAGFRWSFDGSAAASSVTMLGTGSGSDREEAAAIDTTAFADGLILETVIPVGPEIQVEQLPEIAQEELEVVTAPYVLTVLTYPHNATNPATNFIGRLWHGDTVDVFLQEDNEFTVADVYRVVELTIRPDLALALVLNRRDASA